MTRLFVDDQVVNSNDNV